MRPALAAAIEINATWRACMSPFPINAATCPSDADGAAIIDKYFGGIGVTMDLKTWILGAAITRSLGKRVAYTC